MDGLQKYIPELVRVSVIGLFLLAMAYCKVESFWILFAAIWLLQSSTLWTGPWKAAIPAKTDALIAQEETKRRMARSVEDRLDELERLKRRDLITPEEYNTKRTDILKDL